jgi:subtilase family serine protease
MAPCAALVIACAVLSAIVLQTNATPSLSGVRLVLHEALADVPQDWVSLGATESATPIHLRIALPSKDVAGLQKTLLDVSTPGSAKYGQHLSVAQVCTRGPRMPPRD